MSLHEQYLYHCRKLMSDFHLSFIEIETLPLDFLLGLEIIDSKVEAAFRENRYESKKYPHARVFIDQIL